jgi:hypothetical protein
MTVVLSSWLMHHVTCQPTLLPGQIQLGLLPCHAATQCWQLEQHDQSQHNTKSIVARACCIPAIACSTCSAQHSRILSVTGLCARSPYQHSLMSRAAQEMGNTWPAGCTVHDCTDVKTAAKQSSTAGSCTLSPRTLVTVHNVCHGPTQSQGSWLTGRGIMMTQFGKRLPAHCSGPAMPSAHSIHKQLQAQQ